MNPLEFLPRPGDVMRIPGGAVWCEGWEVSYLSGYGRGEVEGTITLRFRQSSSDYVDLRNQPIRNGEMPLPERRCIGPVVPQLEEGSR